MIESLLTLHVTILQVTFHQLIAMYMLMEVIKMKQLDLFTASIKDQVSELKPGDDLKFKRGEDTLVVQKHHAYLGCYHYTWGTNSGYVLHTDEADVMDSFIECISRWLEHKAWRE